MFRYTCLVLILSLAISAEGQQSLSESAAKSRYTYIYPVNEVIVKALYTGQKLDDRVLTVPVDSFLTNGGKPRRLPFGNYVKVVVDKNSLLYELLEYRNVSVKILENTKDVQFILVDREGQEISDAEVSLDGKKIRYDDHARLYHAHRGRKASVLVRVVYKGLPGFTRIVLNRLPKPGPVFTGRLPQKGKKADPYSGYLVFNKPLYKPADTVRLKAFVLKGKRHRPVEGALSVRIIGSDVNKELGEVLPKHPGAYDFKFALHDSLKLRLDSRYLVELYRKDEVFRSATFSYEDYLLKSVSFTMRGDPPSHSKNQSQAIYLKATDENGLPVMDGRVTLTLLPYASLSFGGNRVFIPDTLWQHELLLDPIGETKVVLPDSIFPDADFQYRADALFLNANNESRKASSTFNYTVTSSPAVVIDLRNDSLHLSFAPGGLPPDDPYIRLSGMNSDGDTVSSLPRLHLPAVVKISPYVNKYEAKGSKASAYLLPAWENAGVVATARKTADSLLVKVSNPRKLPFWFTVLQGDRVIDRGRAVDLDYRTRNPGAGSTVFFMSYVWGDQWNNNRVNVVLDEHQLNIDVKQPLAVSPGERKEIELSVSDAKGKAVADVDLTAYAITSKFNYAPPVTPYLGKPQPFPIRGRLPVVQSKKAVEKADIPLDWERWRKRLGLDTLEYFRFTHPEVSYRTVVKAREGLTQIAPFVVDKGSILPVEILYLNEKPVYFSQAQQEERYSFHVSPGMQKIRFRLKDKWVVVDSVKVASGEKLVISFNLAAPAANRMTITPATPVLSDYEASLLNNYLVRVGDADTRFARVNEPSRVFLLPNIQNDRVLYPRDSKLIGPISNTALEYRANDLPPVYFSAEPFYTYTFQPGLIVQKLTDGKYPFFTALSRTQPQRLTDDVLSNRQADSLWRRYLDLRSNTTTFFRNPSSPYGATARLSISYAPATDGKALPLVKNILVYKDDEPDFLHMYRGSETRLGNFVPGNYRILVLLEKEAYVVADHVVLRGKGQNLVKISLDRPLPKDSVSTRIWATIVRYSLAQKDERKPSVDPIKEVFNSQYADTRLYKSVMGGTVYDLGMRPLPGAAVTVKGTQVRTTTDINGRFRIPVPASGKLVIRYIGCEPQEVVIANTLTAIVQMIDQSGDLAEVAVGYGPVRGKSNGRSLEVSDYSEMAAVSSMLIRGMSTPSASERPLFIIDGVPADESNVDAADVVEVAILAADKAMVLYGSRGVNGVVIITTRGTKSKTALEVAEGGGTGIRKNFSDYAFWQPQLRTDAEGKAKFQVTFPDDITQWRTFVIAMNGKQQSGFTQGSIKAFKPLSAALVGPQFALAGDTFRPLGKIMNYTSDTVRVHREFRYNDKVVLNGNLTVKNAHIDTFRVVADDTDSLRFRYAIAKESGYGDGEERTVPVFRPGVFETLGRFEALEKDTALTFSFDPRWGKVTFRAEASVLPELLRETGRLRDYEYFCNEQLASKLKALVIEKKVRAYLGQPFEHDKLVKQLITKLSDARGKDATWGWWPGADTELWISRHAIEAFLLAEDDGYAVPLKQKELTDYLVYRLAAYPGSEKLEALTLLQTMNAAVDYRDALRVLDGELSKAKTRLSLAQKFRLLRVKQLAGLPVTVDSLLRYKKSTLFGNLYFGENNEGMFDNSVQTSLLAYALIKAEGKHPEWLVKLRNFFLEQRRDGSWRNTYESSLILETILPDLLGEARSLRPVTLTLPQVAATPVNTFPYTATLDAATPIRIQKTGDLPLYITAYQQFWNPQPAKVSKSFAVNTWFKNSGGTVTDLVGGTPVVLVAEVTATADADFVMVEVPIPAGCSYEEKAQTWWGNEVHREYFKNKVSIFCRKLPQGKYTFEVKLMPRYDGTYTLNPAKAEMMYFPVFYGREGMKTIKIGP